MDAVPVLPVFRAAFTSPALAVETIMTCKVFRDVVLGYITDVNNTLLPIPMTVIATCDSAFENEYKPET